MINIYLYYYSNYDYIITYLSLLGYVDEYSNRSYDRYVLTNKYKKLLTVVVYKNSNILAIQGDEDKIKDNFRNIAFMEKVNLLDKILFDKLFEKCFSNNLCNISIDINILGSEEELVKYEGNNLLELSLLEQFDFYDDNSNTKLKAYSLQPQGYRYLLKFSSINKLEFNKRYDMNQIESIILDLAIIIKLIEGGGSNK